MIDPEEITQELQALSHYTILMPIQKPLQNPDGSYLIDKEGNAQYVTEYIQATKDRPWAMAALGYLNKVWPTIWMTPFEADTTKIRIRTAFMDIRKIMPFNEKKEYGPFLKMVMNLCLARCEDMKDGHKPLLLKVRREKLDVNMTRGPQIAGQKQ